MKTAFLLPALCCALLTASLPAATPDELRVEAEKLTEKARQAKSEGRPGDAEELMGRAKRIQAELHEKVGGGGLERMKREIGELHRAGKHEEAERLERQFAEAHQRRSGGDKKAPQVEGPERIGHIMEAVKHLRIAGLNEPADNLEQMARRMREELENRGASAAGQMEHAMREMHEGMEQLRRQMEKMQHQIEELRERAAKPRGEAEKS